MTNLQYILYSIAAALIKAGESLKDSADNVPAGVGFGAPDADGVIQPTSGAPVAELTNSNPPAVDGAGLPWDERIHSGGKSIKADGTWTKRKGATPPVVAAVEAELRAKQAGGTPTGTLALPGTMSPAGGLALPGALTPVKVTKYAELCAFLAANTGPGKVADQAWVDAAFASWGTTLPALAAAAADDATVDAYLGEFKKVLTPSA